ncbi:hypothetical protein DL93DRAFT_2093168 [Clavulina sp. PMI_390]|nr:hypothetical protein DL93DRAFT_2093168 [Clavulina sp. PMI_390]
MTTRRARTSDPSPDYDHTEATPALEDKKPIVDEKAVEETGAGPSGTSEGVALAKAEEAGVTSIPATSEIASTSPASPTLSKEEVLSQHAVGTFASGAVVANPTSDPSATLHSRTATADAELSEAARSKILKAEGKNAKQMEKIVKGEARAQASTLKAAVTELGRLQKIQKEAAANESKALNRHTRAVANEQKLSAAYAKAKAAFEAAQAELTSAAENLEMTREHARQQTEALKTKTLEVEQATLQKATDDREREIKLAELKTIQAK